MTTDPVLEAITARLAELAAQREELEAALNAVINEEERNLAARYALTGSVNPQAERPKSRTLVVEDLLHSRPEGMRRKEIVDTLRDRGMEEDPNDISASLAYLRRNGRVTNESGVWLAAEAP